MKQPALKMLTQMSKTEKTRPSHFTMHTNFTGSAQPLFEKELTTPVAPG